MCEDKELKKVVESNKDKVNKKWQKLHKETFHSLYTSPNIAQSPND
jgi:hypothetical protein